MARRPARKSIESRLTAVERGIKSLHATDMAIIKEMRDGFSQMESRFAHLDSRFDQIYNHIDGFMKLHETLDITHNPVSVVRFLLSEETRYVNGANIHPSGGWRIQKE